jgi:mannose-1-phosphate guanylyltransferase
LGSLGLTTPKALVDVGGEPLLQRHLQYLTGQGFQRVVINAHHLADRVTSFVDAYGGPLEVVLIKEPVLLGTAGGVRNALSNLGPEPFLVLYADVLIDCTLGPLLRAHEMSGADATIGVYSSTEREGKGLVELDDERRVLSFVEKGSTEGSETVLVNAGVYVLSPAFVEQAIPEGIEIDFGHDVFPAALGSGRRLFGHLLPGPVIDVGTPEGLERARARSSR